MMQPSDGVLFAIILFLMFLFVAVCLVAITQLPRITQKLDELIKFLKQNE